MERALALVTEAPFKGMAAAVASLGTSALSIVAWLRGAYRTISSLTVRGTLSRIIYMMEDGIPRPEAIRSQFADEPGLEARKPIENHTHATSARDRSGAAAFACVFARNLGLTPYFVQRSRADERESRAGSRTYYWAKDFSASPEEFNPPDRALLVLIDVDYYIDMPALADMGYPILMYTLTPTSAAHCGEYSFRFEANGEVLYTVAGGAIYRHSLWDYNSDAIRVVRSGAIAALYVGVGALAALLSAWKRPFLLITMTCALALALTEHSFGSYLIDRRPVDEHHSLVLLTPLTRWSGISAGLVVLLETISSVVGDSFACARDLVRLNPVRLVNGRNYVRMDVQTKDGMLRSTGIAGTYLNTTINASDDDALAVTARTSKTELSMAAVQAYVDDRALAAPLLEFHRAQQSTPSSYVCSLEESTRTYTFEPESYDPEDKPAEVAIASAVIPPAYVPLVNAANERRSVEARIKNLRRDDKPRPLSHFIYEAMLEFVARMIPDSRAGRGHPVDDDEVRKRQDRPSQQRIIEDAMWINADERIEAFMKKETYPEVKDPRNISTINGVDKVAYSKVIYALNDFVVESPSCEWYAFGKTPAQIAARVVKILGGAKCAVNTDLSRFDGRVSEIVRVLERLILLRFFHPMHHASIISLHRSQYFLRGYGKYGTKYEQMFSRASGSPETAIFNSVVNAFMAYLAYRMTRRGGCFIQPDEAYALLGIYGGDDGVSVDIDAEIYTRACDALGQKLEAETIQRGRFGVNFLARVYGPDVWFGDANSVADTPRQLAKLHLTVAMPPGVTNAQKMYEKCLSLVLTDVNTPLLGCYARAFTAMCEAEGVVRLPVVARRQLCGWFSRYDEAVQFPNDVGDWATEYAERCLPGFDFRRFYDAIAAARSTRDLLAMPMCVDEPEPEKAPPAPVVVSRDGHTYKQAKGDRKFGEKAGKPKRNAKVAAPVSEPATNPDVKDRKRGAVDKKAAALHARGAKRGKKV